jgi:hypothetical protein
MGVARSASLGVNSSSNSKRLRSSRLMAPMLRERYKPALKGAPHKGSFWRFTDGLFWKYAYRLIAKRIMGSETSTPASVSRTCYTSEAACARRSLSQGVKVLLVNDLEGEVEIGDLVQKLQPIVAAVCEGVRRLRPAPDNCLG